MTGTGESENFPPFKNCDLRDDVGGGTESVKTEPSRIATFPQRAKPDQARTQQRRGRDILELIGKRKTKTRIGHGKFRIAAVDVIAGEPRAIAKIFAAGTAEPAFATSPAQPRNANAIAFAKFLNIAGDLLDPADDFVTGN